MDQNLSVRKDLIGAMISILSQGIQTDQLDDSETLLAAIAALNPKLDCITEFSSYIAIKRGFIGEALQICASAQADTSKWHVLMALCLKLAGDPTWNGHANRSLEMTDPSSQYSHALARVLLGMPPIDDSKDDSDASKKDESNFTDYPGSHANYLAI